MDWKHLLAYITGTVDQELLLRNAYLVTENRILRNQLQDRVRLRGCLESLPERIGSGYAGRHDDPTTISDRSQR
jgi:putative transposase